MEDPKKLDKKLNFVENFSKTFEKSNNPPKETEKLEIKEFFYNKFLK